MGILEKIGQIKRGEIVCDFNREYRKKKWLTEEDVAMAEIDDAENYPWMEKALRNIELDKGTEA